MMTKNLLSTTFDLAREMDRLFESMVSGPMTPARWQRLTFPAVNVWEDEGNLYAEAELPGLTLKEIEVSVTGDTLSVNGERRFELPEGATPLRRERGLGQFERTIVLPCDIDAEKVEATLRDGILSITLPKSAGCQPRRIAVKTA